MSSSPRLRGRFRLLAATFILSIIFAPSYTALAAQATPEASPEYAPFRFDETVSLTLASAVRSREAGPPPDDWRWPQRALEELNVAVEVQWSTDPTQYTETIRTRAAANDLPDVFVTDSSTTALLADQGIIGDWAPLLQFMPNYVQQRNVQQLAPVGTLDGTHYGLVTQNPEPFKGVTAIRGDWLEALGLQPPKTTDEFLEVARAFTEQDPDGNGQNDTWGFTGAPDFEGFISGFTYPGDRIGYSFGGAFGDVAPWQIVDGQLVNSAITDQHRQNLEFVSRLSQAGVIDPDWTSQEILDSESKFKSGRIGIVFTDWCLLFCVQGYSEFKGAVPNGTWTIIDPPVGPNGDQSQGGYSNAGPQFAVSQKAIDEGRGEAVARLLEWINGPGYVPTAFGEEGLTFTVDESGNRVQETAVETIPYRQLTAWAYNGSPDEFQTRYGNTTTYDDGETIDVLQVLERCAQYPVTDTTQWAVLPPAPAAIYADYVRTRAEAEFAFMTGSRSLEEWDAHVETLRAVGLDQWTAEATTRAQEVGLL